MGTQGNGDTAYTVWFDDMRFENLGTVAQPRPAIFGGLDLTEEVFVGSSRAIPGVEVFNLANGQDQIVLPAPAYFTYNSSDTTVATVGTDGIISIIGSGTATITAEIDGVAAQGSLTVNSVGEFDGAPIPDKDPNNVLSIYSDAYASVPGFNLAVFNNSDIIINESVFDGDAVVRYENLAFVGLDWEGTSNVSDFDFLHVDIQVSQSFNPSTDAVVVELIDWGVNDANGGGDDTGGGYRVSGQDLQQDQWIGIDIPLNGFTLPTGGGFAGSPNLNSIANVVFVGAGISNVIIDNIYFFKQ